MTTSYRPNCSSAPNENADESSYIYREEYCSSSIQPGGCHSHTYTWEGLGDMRKLRPWPTALWALAVLIGVMVPMALAVGSHGGDPVTSGSASVIELKLGNQDKVTWLDESQSISTRRNDCTLVSFGTDPQLLVVSAFGGVLGEVKDGLGVQSPSDGAGEPCGRVEAADSEAISVSLGSTLDGYLMTAVDVDLELKFDAVVTVEFLHEGSVVATDTFDPSTGSDDGPDSADLDNYRYFHRPGVTGAEEPDQVFFDEVKFTPTNGSISLEGGADGTEAGSLASSNTSQFEVITTFDGEITCGETANIGVEGTDSVYGGVTLHAMDFGPVDGNWEITNCLLKPFNADVTDTAFAFVPQLEDTSARYTAEITVEDQALTVDGNGQITSLIAEYDPSGDLSFPDESTAPLQACEGQPNLDSTDAGYAAFWGQADVGLLPAGESACFYSAAVTPTSAGFATENWGVYFEDDPGFSFR